MIGPSLTDCVRRGEPLLECPPSFGRFAVQVTVPATRWRREQSFLVSELGYFTRPEVTWWFHPDVAPRRLRRLMRQRFAEHVVYLEWGKP